MPSLCKQNNEIPFDAAHPNTHIDGLKAFKILMDTVSLVLLLLSFMHLLWLRMAQKYVGIFCLQLTGFMCPKKGFLENLAAS